jgi:PGF-CTERM protein
MPTARRVLLLTLVVTLLTAPVAATASTTRAAAASQVASGTPSRGSFAAAVTTEGSEADRSPPGQARASSRRSPSTTGASRPAARAGDALRLTSVLRLTPSESGAVTVTMEYAIPDSVSAIEARLPADSQVTATRGFSSQGDRWYEWDGRRDSPSITYRLQVNETIRETGPTVSLSTPASQVQSPTSGLVFADPGPWAIVRLPSSTTRYSGRGTAPEFEWGWRVDGAGAVGESIAYLGDHETIRREASGQTLRLVVPAEADLAAPPGEVLTSLADASRALAVGERDPELFFVAAPTNRVQWAVEGVNVGQADVWVRDDTPLDHPDNTWLHEYVHTRQDYALGPEVRWFTQASATYYGALLTLEQGRIGFDEFRRFLAVGEGRPQADSVLGRPATWANGAEYTKGALVAGELDRRLRLAGGSLDEVFRRMNAREGDVDAEAFYGSLAAVGDESVAQAGRRYVQETTVPTVWTREQHRRAFGPLPTHLRVRFERRGDAFETRGPFGNRTVGSQRPVTLAADETLVARATVANTGDSAGEYTVRFLVDGEVAGRASGRVGPEERLTVPLTHRFDAPGNYTVSVTGEARADDVGTVPISPASVEVSVREPARLEVTNVTVNRTDVVAGDRVSLAATVTNDDRVPGRTTVVFFADGDPAGEVQVTLAGGETGRVSVTTALESPGTHELGVANGSAVTVRVAAPASPTPVTDAETRSEPTSTPVPGFGVPTALVAVLVVVLLVRGRFGRG